VGLERPRDASDLLPPRPQGRAQRRAAVRRRPPAHGVGAMGRHLAGPRRRHRHRAVQHDGARDHPRRPDQRPLHRARDDRLRGVPRLGRAVDAGGGRARHRRPRAGHPRARSRVRARGPRDPLLDARHHRARHRRRQRPVAHQPRAADRPRRALRLGPEPAARPEQRPGRRRHGRDPQQAARLPGRPGRPRRPRPLRGRVGLRAPARAWLASLADVRRHGARRAQHALRAGREPRAVRGRLQARPRAARGPGLHDRPGHPHDQDVRDGGR